MALLAVVSLSLLAMTPAVAAGGVSIEGAASGLDYIDTGFENASPLWYNITPEGNIEINLLYDHERNSPNRAAGHIHFRIHAKPGARLKFEFNNLRNIYNGRPASVAPELKAVAVSADGTRWRMIPLQSIETNRVQMTLEMPGPEVFVARVEPYRVSDLDRFLREIKSHPEISIETIGETVEGRSLEILTVGDPTTPRRVFMRARAHPWEPGGNWVVEGLVKRMIAGDADAARFRGRFCLHILPMANKDGVAHGRTRFNLRGKDLNRDWDRPADPVLAPENHALEQWLNGMIQRGRKPHLAIEWHNDGYGRLHVGRPLVTGLNDYLESMRRLEECLRKNTWFTEGTRISQPGNSGTLGDGWFARFEINAVVHELNCNWIQGLKDYPSAQHWQAYGASLAEALYEYFE